MFGLRSASRSTPALPQILMDAQLGHAILIDVRDISELKATGKIKGAKHIPIMQLANVADRRHPDFDTSLTADADIAVYCASGGRSRMATQILAQLGFQNVTDMGGFGHLVSTGAEVDAL